MTAAVDETAPPAYMRAMMMIARIALNRRSRSAAGDRV